MSDGDQDFTGSSGGSNDFDVDYENREVVIAFGVGFHRWDRIKDGVPEQMGAAVSINDDDEIEYTNPTQGVHYRIRAVFTKSEFKTALETEDLMVIYAGHSRYGRGACFADLPDQDGATADPGEHWETGTTSDEGMFRMGYPFVPVHLSDIRDHGYTCRPVSASAPAPAREVRGPEAAADPVAVEMPDDLRGQVDALSAADDNLYWGYAGAQPEVLLRAGWLDTPNSPYDLGGTDLQCRCFCHFGCSSRLHFRELIRGSAYKGWQRDDPPTTRFAYFTTAAAPPDVTTIYWLAGWLKAAGTRKGTSWSQGLADARSFANQKIRQRRATEPVLFGYEIY